MTSSIIPANELGTVYFIGIGGAGMSGIARVMLEKGLVVAGSDAKDSSVVAALRAQGATVHIGHAAAQVAGFDTIVVSSAIKQDNPELVAAREAGARVLHRSEALASLMAGSEVVAVAGTHGKTTTTSMTVVGLQAGGLDPSFVIGGVLSASGTNAHLGSSSAFVAEADESDGSFLLYTPTVGVITNVEADHLDHYGSWEAVHEAFVTFCAHVAEQDGTVVACADDPGSLDIALAARANGAHVVLYGQHADADWRITGFTASAAGARFTIVTPDGELGPVELKQPGAYNAANATAAVCVAAVLGADVDAAVRGVGAFTGTKRRFELKGAVDGVRVFDDYAHHPTELTAVLTAARGVVEPGAKVHVIFQPHLFSRTRDFKVEFGQALGLADDVAVLDVYPAREAPVPGVTGALVADEVPHGNVAFIPAFNDAVGYMAGRVAAGDIVITAGAGDVTILGPQLVEELNRSGRRS